MNCIYVDDIALPTTAAIMIFTLLKEKKTKLKTLSMANNDITDDVCDIIDDSLSNNSLEDRYICGNKISKEATQLILNCLRQNNTMKDLYLPRNYSKEDRNNYYHFRLLLMLKEYAVGDK